MSKKIVTLNKEGRRIRDSFTPQEVLDMLKEAEKLWEVAAARRFHNKEQPFHQRMRDRLEALELDEHATIN